MTFDIDNLQDLSGQVAAITGGNGGIGESGVTIGTSDKTSNALLALP